MKIQLLQENLIRSLVLSTRIIQQKSQLPILEHILINAKPDGSTITAASIDMTVIIRIRSKTDHPGTVCVPAKLLHEFVSTLPKETVTMEVEKEQMRLSCGKVNASFSTVPAAEFPPLTVEDNPILEPLESGEFSRAIERVLFSAAHDDSRPVLAGVRMRKNEGRTEFVTTDGYRLSIYKTPIAVPVQENTIVPARALREILRIIAEKKTQKEIFMGPGGENQILFRIEDIDLYCRRIEGEFPAFERIIPKTSTTRCTLNREEFIQAVRTVSIFARDNANIVQFSITGGVFTVRATSAQLGEGQVGVESQTEGDDAEIAFNSRFLIEYLSAIPDETIIFEMTGALNPGAFKVPGEEEHLHIIMPVRLQGE